jgi:hypothetical protein
MLAGIVVMLQVGSAEEATHGAAAGVDFIVAQGVEAGGHVRGQVGLLPLLSAVVESVAPVPVIAAGGIVDGHGAGCSVGRWVPTACGLAPVLSPVRNLRRIRTTKGVCSQPPRQTPSTRKSSMSVGLPTPHTAC